MTEGGTMLPFAAWMAVASFGEARRYWIAAPILSMCKSGRRWHTAIAWCPARRTS